VGEVWFAAVAVFFFPQVAPPFLISRAVSAGRGGGFFLVVGCGVVLGVCVRVFWGFFGVFFVFFFWLVLGGVVFDL